MRGVEVSPQATGHVITADSPRARNSFATPDAIRPRRELIAAGRAFEMLLPARSVSIVSLGIARPGEARP